MDENERKGSWATMYSGERYWPLDPLPEDVILEDIAHSLGMQCRYNGHTKIFYSVAEHSVLLAKYFIKRGEMDLAKWALLHDASETYLTDFVRPVKKHFPQYRHVEYLNMNAIALKFKLPLKLDAWSGFSEQSLMPPQVAIADTQILNNERDQVLLPSKYPWDCDPRPLPDIYIEGWSPVLAKTVFKHWFKRLWGEDANVYLDRTY